MKNAVLALANASTTDPVAALPCGDRMKKAVTLVGDGTPYRDAAKEVGYRDHPGDVSENAARFARRRQQSVVAATASRPPSIGSGTAEPPR